MRILLTTTLLVFFSSFTFGDSNESGVEEKFNPTEKVLHHIQDAHDWHLWGDVSIPLPIIFYIDGEVDFFMSSVFHHNDDGTYIHKIKGRRYVKYHGDIYQLEKGAKRLLFDPSDKEHKNGPINAIKRSHTVADFSLTKNIAAMIISVLLLFLLLRATALGYKKHKSPKGIQAFLEPLILFVRDDIVKLNIGKKYKKFTTFLLTVFFFILINNLLGLLPGAANVTGNISVTLVLSFFTFIMVTISANKGYWMHIVKPPGTPIPLLPIMIPIEVFGVFTKPFALMIRLFANITAGHIIILSLISLIFVASNNGENAVAGYSVAPVSMLFVLFIYLIEVLVAFLQAYIFTLLSAVFIGLAVKDEH